MNEKNYQQLITILTIFLVVLSISVLSWGYYNYRLAQNIVNPERVISFSAEGKVLAKPDIAKIVIGVITQGEKTEAVQEENNKKMKEAIDFLKDEGVSEDDIKTTSYNLVPQYDYNWCRQQGQEATYYISCPPKIIGYQLSQIATIKIRDFDKINTIIGGLSERRINQISNISFEIDDPETYENEARIQALNKIEERAKILSAKTSIRLGKIVNISEGSSIYPSYRSLEMEKMMVAGGVEDVAASEAPIETGTEEISIILNVDYELK
ncbi:MAG: SIMPL domain-containing protein [Candidatus Pacebacteria bacterium]|nr:SIMPL domain-containing protein [Candidatus Paceibacterota bacterium]